MQPSYSSIGQVFSAPMRYVVPLFQRPYVWSRDAQWQPLWDDVAALADRVLDPPAHKPIAGHFLGTVVLEQVNTLTVELPQRQVIDGQQRLTTLQLMLKAAQHALDQMEAVAAPEAKVAFQNAAGQISQLTLNQFTATAEERFKVWPTNEDREPFRAIMSADNGIAVSAGMSRMAEAYAFFREAILEWLRRDRHAERAVAFAAALKSHLRIIVLDLDDNDEPQAIFETLNAHGTPLLPADLIKNWLLWQATKQSLDVTGLYLEFWRPFDAEHDYWRKIVGTGHAARPRVDTFLQNWLSVRTGETTAIKHLYDRFLAYAVAHSHDVSAVMADIAKCAVLYRRIDQPSGNRAMDASLRRLNRLDFVVFRPVLIAVLEREGVAAEDQLQCVTALESFLVRRMVCNAQTRGYGALALELVRVVTAANDDLVRDALLEVLIGGEGSANEWPDDQSFAHNWTSRRFYGWFRRDRVLMLLQAIEEILQRANIKSEPILAFDFSKLTIEHVMPQTWQQHWPLPDHVTALERDDAVQNIGNLTLVSDRLNPSLSNAAWSDGAGGGKRVTLQKYAKLELNRNLVNDHPGTWDEATIQARAQQLFNVAASLWRAPPTLRPSTGNEPLQQPATDAAAAAST